MFIILSKATVLILSIIAEKPSSPFEIAKLLEHLNTSKWLPIGESSVYATIKSLRTKGYIDGKIEKNGNMPDKTMYTVTTEGELALKNNLSEFLASTDLDTAKFNLSIMLICHLDKASVMEILQQKLYKYGYAIEGMKKNILYLESNKLVPSMGLSVIKHSMHIMEAEIKTIEEIILQIPSDKSWDHFPAKDIRII